MGCPLIIVNPQTLEFEAVPNSGADGKRAAGMQAVVLAISKEVDMVLTGKTRILAKHNLVSITDVKVARCIAATTW